MEMFSKPKTEKTKFQFPLGSKLRDRVSGYTGIAESRTEFMNGCIRYSIQGPVKADGEMVQGWSLDEAQLEYVDDGLNDRPVEKSATGGPKAPKAV